ncbi:lactoylglutathione lyase [Olea europaea var. sylvestris]|uniref:lactoylglutathione lyase n=1 Tax=Olea europaea var. sylvestris TaxID=158386 RepID=UPI000C1D35D9|nr:lactoylglutathione lyase [Olea europaea var. sylvestris]
MQCKKDQTTENEQKQEQKQGKEHEIPLLALNHVSRVCSSVKDSVDFYTKVLGFVLIERPEAFDFDGAWLFNYGVGIHLVHAKDDEKLPQDRENLDPMDNHISFQCENMEAMEQKLKDHNIKYIKRTVGDEDEGAIDQLFFNDPDGFMIEICNCENLKLVPQGSLGYIKLPIDRHNPPIELEDKAGD